MIFARHEEYVILGMPTGAYNAFMLWCGLLGKVATDLNISHDSNACLKLRGLVRWNGLYRPYALDGQLWPNVETRARELFCARSGVSTSNHCYVVLPEVWLQDESLLRFFVHTEAKSTMAQSWEDATGATMHTIVIYLDELIRFLHGRATFCNTGLSPVTRFNSFEEVSRDLPKLLRSYLGIASATSAAFLKQYNTLLTTFALDRRTTPKVVQRILKCK